LQNWSRKLCNLQKWSQNSEVYRTGQENSIVVRKSVLTGGCKRGCTQFWRGRLVGHQFWQDMEGRFVCQNVAICTA
jgi:hypothetical protein